MLSGLLTFFFVIEPERIKAVPVEEDESLNGTMVIADLN